MHWIMNYQEYGRFMNYDAGTGDRGLRTWTESISRTAQKEVPISSITKIPNTYLTTYF
jgi:hypothetical protein